MKLLLVSNTYPPGDISGVGTLVFELAAEARRRRLDVRVLTRRSVGEGAAGVVSTGGAKVLFPLLAASRCLGIVRRWVPDVIHVHESDGVLIVLLVRLGRLLRRPWGRCRVVATLQVSYVEERRAVRPVRTQGRAVSWPVRSERVFAWLRAPVLASLGRISGRLSDAVIAPSEVTRHELRRDYGLAAVTVIPNGIDVGRPPEAKTTAADTPPTILYVGRLRTRKAVAVLVEAMHRLVMDGCEARLLIAGSGEQELALRTQCRNLGLDRSVRFAGAVRRSELSDHYCEASIFCLPSTYEGFPLAILEAMAVGLPIVSTTVAGIPEAVDHRKTGLLVEPENAEALADALRSLLEDPEQRRAMGDAGRRKVESEFSIERIAGSHLRLFEELTE